MHSFNKKTPSGSAGAFNGAVENLTVSGSLILSHNPVLPLEAATRDYVDTAIANALAEPNLFSEGGGVKLFDDSSRKIKTITAGRNMSISESSDGTLILSSSITPKSESVRRVYNPYDEVLIVDDGNVVAYFVQATIKLQNFPAFGEGFKTTLIQASTLPINISASGGDILLYNSPTNSPNCSTSGKGSVVTVRIIFVDENGNRVWVVSGNLV